MDARRIGVFTLVPASLTDPLLPSQQGRSGAEIEHRLLTDSPKDVG